MQRRTFLAASIGALAGCGARERPDTTQRTTEPGGLDYAPSEEVSDRIDILWTDWGVIEGTEGSPTATYGVHGEGRNGHDAPADVFIEVTIETTPVKGPCHITEQAPAVPPGWTFYFAAPFFCGSPDLVSDYSYNVLAHEV